MINLEKSYRPIGSLQFAIVWVKVWMHDCRVPGFEDVLVNWLIFLKKWSHKPYKLCYYLCRDIYFKWSEMFQSKLTVTYSSFLPFPSNPNESIIFSIFYSDFILNKCSLTNISYISSMSIMSYPPYFLLASSFNIGQINTSEPSYLSSAMRSLIWSRTIFESYESSNLES